MGGTAVSAVSMGGTAVSAVYKSQVFTADTAVPPIGGHSGAAQGQWHTTWLGGSLALPAYGSAGASPSLLESLLSAEVSNSRVATMAAPLMRPSAIDLRPDSIPLRAAFMNSF